MEDEEAPWHERVDPASPDRCQAVALGGDQCRFKVKEYEGRKLKYCHMHATGQLVAVKREVKRLYDLQKYRSQVDRLHQEQPNLDEELGMQRLLLEKIFNKFEDVEFITQSGRITQLVREIRETMVANLKLKSAMGQLLDRVAIQKLCDAVVAIAQELVPKDKMDAFAARVAGAIAEAVSARVDK